MILEQKILKEITEDKVCLCVTEQCESNLFSSVCIWINDNIFIYTMELALKKKGRVLYTNGKMSQYIFK